MPNLVILEGPNAGHTFALVSDRPCLISRNAEAEVPLASNSVSRRHAEVYCDKGAYFIKDLGSVNGTFLNGERLIGSKPLADGDELEVCEFVLAFQEDISPDDETQNILARIDVTTSNAVLFTEHAENKLQTVLLLAQQLGQKHELAALLEQLLTNLLQLFPVADRGLVVLCEDSRLIVAAQRTRRDAFADFTYSRTVVREALKAGCGILSQNAQKDARFQGSESLAMAGATSLLCVPLLGQDGKPLGAVQLDSLHPLKPFTAEHLRLLTTLTLMAAVVLENVRLNEVRIRAESLRRELALGRAIQFGFLPTDFTTPAGSDYELFAQIHPAREVSGDLYDFFPIAGGRLAFLVGDVSDKGIPAAMLMVKVQTLVRHLATSSAGPAQTLAGLNEALVPHNPTSMFVTLIHGIFDPATGAVTLASGGHPRPLLRNADGQINELAIPVGRLIGSFEGDLRAPEVRFNLDHGQTLILFSDGYTEATATGKKMFGLEQLKETLGGSGTPLQASAARARQAIHHFIGGGELQDDLTLFLLRRN